MIIFFFVVLRGGIDHPCCYPQEEENDTEELWRYHGPNAVGSSRGFQIIALRIISCVDELVDVVLDEERGTRKVEGRRWRRNWRKARLWPCDFSGDWSVINYLLSTIISDTEGHLLPRLLLSSSLFFFFNLSRPSSSLHGLASVM